MLWNYPKDNKHLFRKCEEAILKLLGLGEAPVKTFPPG